MNSSVTFELPDPLAEDRTKFAYVVFTVARMTALDRTKGMDPKVEAIAADVALAVAGEVLGVIDGNAHHPGYYLMPHNEQSKQQCNLSGTLQQVYDSLYDDIDN